MKDIKGYEGLYAITSCGKVWSYRRKIFLKPGKNAGGYLQVVLSKNDNKETKKIHRLVMETYCPTEGMNDLQVNHLDENKENNCLSNLEWCDSKYNNNYGDHNKRSAASRKNDLNRSKKVRCIETGIIYESVHEAARQTGISNGNISQCCNGKRKSAGGFHWEFVEVN